MLSVRIISGYYNFKMSLKMLNSEENCNIYDDIRES